MANSKHLARLKKHLANPKRGFVDWNMWRLQNIDVQPDLSGADLRGADLSGFNLGATDLSNANLRGANLQESDLTMAYLAGADLHKAHLLGTNLTASNLRGANLTGHLEARERQHDEHVLHQNRPAANHGCDGETGTGAA